MNVTSIIKYGVQVIKDKSKVWYGFRDEGVTVLCSVNDKGDVQEVFKITSPCMKEVEEKIENIEAKLGAMDE